MIYLRAEFDSVLMHRLDHFLQPGCYPIIPKVDRFHLARWVSYSGWMGISGTGKHHARSAFGAFRYKFNQLISDPFSSAPKPTPIADTTKRFSISSVPTLIGWNRCISCGTIHLRLIVLRVRLTLIVHYDA